MNWTICLLFLICVRRHCRWRWKTKRRVLLRDAVQQCCDMAFLATFAMVPFIADVNGQGDPVKENFCNKTNGSITDYFSPNWPDPYPNNSDCSTILKAPADHVIELDFRGQFNIEGRDCHQLRNPFVLWQQPINCYCQYDFLEIRNGPYKYSNLIGRFCGRIPPPTLRSTGRYLFIRFKSDDAIQFDGFYIYYKYVKAPPAREGGNATNCHIILDEQHGYVNSTSIPKLYSTDAGKRGVPMDCIFEIRVANDSHVMLGFSEIKLAKPDDCDIDFIDVHAASLDIHDRVRQYCKDYNNENVLVNSSKVLLRFMSDSSKLTENNFIGYYTAVRPAEHCLSDTEFSCGDGTCVKKDLLCNKRQNCLTNADEADCEPGFNWKKTTLQSVIISVVVGVIIIGVLAVAIYLTCHERQISQPRRLFTPAPLHKPIVTDEFGYGCTVDEMMARSQEERMGYFIRHVQTPIEAHRLPSSRLVTSHSNTSSDWLRQNGTSHSSHTNSLPLSHSRPGRRAFGAATQPRTPLAVRTSPQTSQATPATTTTSDESYYVAGEDLDLHTSLRNGVPVFMYSPHTKRRLLRVA